MVGNEGADETHGQVLLLPNGVNHGGLDVSIRRVAMIVVLNSFSDVLCVIGTKLTMEMDDLVSKCCVVTEIIHIVIHSACLSKGKELVLCF